MWGKHAWGLGVLSISVDQICIYKICKRRLFSDSLWRLLLLCVDLSTWSLLSGYRTVDALLQRMFEADLNLDDLAENDNIDADSSGNFANPAFVSAWWRPVGLDSVPGDKENLHISILLSWKHKLNLMRIWKKGCSLEIAMGMSGKTHLIFLLLY